MAKMYLVCGMSGVGKTTFARQLAEDRNCKYFCPDDYYAKINGDDCIRDNKFEVWMAMWRDIHEAEVNNLDCVVDTNALNYNGREEFLDWFPTFEHHLIYIHAKTFEQCLENNAKRRRKIPEDAMWNMLKRLQIPHPEEDKRWVSFTWLTNVNNVLKGERNYE